MGWNERANTVLPAGGFGNFDPSFCVDRGHGSRIWDNQGNEFVDFLIGSGPMILGHAHPEVTEVVVKQLHKGTTFFANNELGIELAEEICRAVACSDQVRFVSSGGEADMYAMRLARAHTGRTKIVKFEGGYHGMSSEALMSLAPTKLKAFPTPVPDSAGIPKSVRDEMLIAPFNDPDYVTELFRQHDNQIAAVIVEPLQRVIPPASGFLQHLRNETQKNGALLIFDEVVTGFRFDYGGAQAYYGVEPDLCTLGKIIGGGFPLAAIAGRESIMRHFDKGKADGRFTFQIGTLSGNPIASVAGLKTLEILRRPGSYKKLFDHGQHIMSSLQQHLGAANIAHSIVGEPPLFDVVFHTGPVTDYRSYLEGDDTKARIFNQTMRAQGILKSDSKFYPSLALADEDLRLTDQAIEAAAQALLD